MPTAQNDYIEKIYIYSKSLNKVCNNSVSAVDEQQEQCGFKTKRTNKEFMKNVFLFHSRLPACRVLPVVLSVPSVGFTRDDLLFTLQRFSGTDNLRCQSDYHGVALNN
jgi:hypothetical protein